MAECQMATPAEIALQEGISSACEAVPATQASPAKKKMKRGLGGIGARVPRVWVPLKKVDRPRSPPTDDTFTALEKLRRIFRHKMDWKIFYEEGVLIGADLIYDKKFELSRNPITWGDIMLHRRRLPPPPNTVPLMSMPVKRPIAFKKVKVVKKGGLIDSSFFDSEAAP
ncbi:hypothetical protein LIER_13015 [Lithospermum erythrorhizon]|uniref:Uncharacterized protein n=1 Tax=Lithospermum erythrorhizon TaxID=34254 RepID=A0AAV3PVV0_LITER